MADAVGVLDAFSVERAVVVGHDFGGMPAWWSGVYAPERVAGIVGVCTPFAPRLGVDLVEAYRRGRGDSTYIVGFQEPGVAEALLERDVEATFRAWLRGVGMSQEAFAQQPAAVRALPMDLFLEHPELFGEPVVDEEELAVYVETYRRTGFTGGLNWYRALGLWHAESEGVEVRVDAPALMISAADDLFLPPAVTAGMEDRVADLTRTLIPDAGHWVTQERPAAFNAALLDWLVPRFGR